MEITVTSRQDTAYWPMFSSAGIEMTVATVEFDIPFEGVTTCTLSHRADDPDGVWCVDSRIGPNGMPFFVHGDGDRTCKKQVAGEELVSLILAWEG